MITIPEGLPVKFWHADDQTFNETEQYGVDKHTYIQKYPCDEPLTIQVTDTHIRGYQVKVIENPTVAHYVPMEREERNGLQVYTATFTMNSIGVCGKCVRIEIVAVEYVVSGVLADDDDQISGSVDNITEVYEVSGTLSDGDDQIAGDITWNEFNSELFGLNPAPCSYVYTLYWSGQWGPGTQMYWDAALTQPVTGYNKIAPSWSGEHFNLSTSGVVGSSTNIFC